MRETFAFFPDRYTIGHELGARPKTIGDDQGRPSDWRLEIGRWGSEIWSRGFVHQISNSNLHFPLSNFQSPIL